MHPVIAPAHHGRRRRSAATLGAVLGTALSLLFALPMPASADIACDRVAAQGGSDGAAGTAAQPFGTAQRLVDSLDPGQTGCVRGTLTGDMWIGRDGVTVASEPGQRGKVVGQVKVQPGADGVTVRDLDLDGRRASGLNIGPAIYGNDATFIGNDVTNGNTAICFILGTFGHDGNIRVQRTRIEGNRIHNCGMLPRNNLGHAIYVEHTQDARIIGNEIFDNADRGVQLYPNSQGTLVAGNVIDGNGVGVIFGGLNGESASNNVVRHNLITNPTARSAVESWYPADTPQGVGNVVEQNCVWGGSNLISTTFGGFTPADNRTVDPQYVDRAAKDFRLREGSPCAAVLEAGRTGAGPLPPAPAPAPTGSTTTTGTTTGTTTDTPVTPSGATTVTAPKTNGRGSTKVRLSLRHRRIGRRKVSLQLRLLDRVAAPVRTLVEVRTGRRGWRLVAAPRMLNYRRYSTRVRMPRSARRILVRASVVQPTGEFVRQLSVVRPAKRFL